MRPTEILIEEHNSIKQMIKIVERVSDKLASGEKVEPEHLEDIVEFIRTFADRYHHGKEEDLLFSAMVEVGIPRESGPIGVMLSEHDLGRKYVRGIADNIGNYRKGDRRAASTIAENARNYAILLAQHINKEDNVLYQMADMHLSEEKQDELSEKFGLVEAEKVGVGKPQELLEILRSLEDVYLSNQTVAPR